MNASSIIIATGKPVMALGGFSGSDQILTVQQLARLVANGTMHYFLIQAGGGPGGSGGNSALVQWVTTHGTVVPSSRYETSSTSATGGAAQHQGRISFTTATSEPTITLPTINLQRTRAARARNKLVTQQGFFATMCARNSL
jgi:hypothetical protein